MLICLMHILVTSNVTIYVWYTVFLLLFKVMDRLCMRVQQQVCVLRAAGEAEEMQAARQVLKEARNSHAVSIGGFMKEANINLK